MATLAVETVSGVVTSWLPLTTGSPPPPPECYSAIYSQRGGAGQLIAFDPFFQRIVPSFSTACFPNEASLWYNQGKLNPLTVTSLGPFECPGGYTTAFTTEESTSTQIACCPIGYAYQGSIVNHGTIGECWSTPKVGQLMHYFTQTGPGTWSEVSTVLGTTHVAGVQINGWNIAIETTSSSEPSPSPSSSSTSSSRRDSSPSETAPGQPGALSTSAPESTAPSLSNAGITSSTGLSTSSKAVLGVGVALAVISIAALAFAFFLLRRQRQLQKQDVAPVAPINRSEFWAGQVHRPKEIDGTQRGSELGTQPGPYYEMSGNYNRSLA